ncbi:MAG: hypothetical protein LKF35_05855 [Bifidobacterium minimum]|nr:hypothetical protein [Bifidobacterium minimum]
MTWWMWLVLIIAAIAIFVAGCVYAVLRGLSALRSMGGTVSAISSAVDAMNDPGAATDAGHTASFALPLSQVARRYEDTRIDIERRRARNHMMHRRIWRNWDRTSIPESLTDTGFEPSSAPMPLDRASTRRASTVSDARDGRHQ